MASSLRLLLAVAFLTGGLCVGLILRWFSPVRLPSQPTIETTTDAFSTADHRDFTAPVPTAPDRFVREGVWGQIATDNQLVMHAPTPPPRGPRLALPWDPHRAVLLAVPLDEVLMDPVVAKIYTEFLSATLPVCPVNILYHRRHRPHIARWLHLLESRPNLAPWLDRISFVVAETDSMWIRDFGPIFGIDQQRRLLVYDTAYIDPRIEISNYLNTEMKANDPDYNAERSQLFASIENMRGSDITPSVFAAHLQVEARLPTRLVRPPLVMAGGDMMQVDTRTVILSQATLEANGGRSDFVEARFAQYLGVNQVHYLQPLPGETIEHIDFIIQVIGTDTILAARPPTMDDQGRRHLRMLNQDLTRRLQANLAYLRTHFPNHRIIEVPMPPPIVASNDNLVDDMFIQIVREAGRTLGVPDDQVMRFDSKNSQSFEISTTVKNYLRDRTGIARIDTLEARGRIIAHIRGVSLSELIADYSEQYTIYRTYLNSLLVNGPDGERILVPRYQPLNPDEAQTFAAYEKELIAAYREARPNAELHWIDCTNIINRFGAVHCFATTLPDPNFLGVGVEKK